MTEPIVTINKKTPKTDPRKIIGSTVENKPNWLLE